MEILTLVITGIGLLLSAHTVGKESMIARKGSILRSKLNDIAVALSKRISKNNNLLNELAQAYNTRNTALLSRVLTGMGFGPRMKSILDMINKNETSYQQNLKEIQAINTEIESQVNEINTAINNAGTSKAGNELAQGTLDKYNQRQNINGGIIETDNSNSAKNEPIGDQNEKKFETI